MTEVEGMEAGRQAGTMALERSLEEATAVLTAPAKAEGRWEEADWAVATVKAQQAEPSGAVRMAVA